MKIHRHTVILVILSCFPVSAVAQVDADEWQFELTPYIWLPTIDGTLTYGPPPGGGGGPSVSVGPTDWLDLINAGLLINGNARKDRFSLFTDLVYLSLQSKNDRVLSVFGNLPGGPTTIPVSANATLNSQSDLDGLIWTLAAGYTMKNTGTMVVDLYAGVRYLGLDASTRWSLVGDITTPDGTLLLDAQGGIEAGTDLTDAIVGSRGYFGVGATKAWTVPFSIDVGAGSSDVTWNAMLGLSRVYDWGDLMLVYRHLAYDEDGSGLMQDFSFSGPAFGARFRF